MKSTVWASLAVSAVITLAATASGVAENALAAKSLWHDARLGCLEIGDVSKPLPGSNECVQFTGSVGKTGPISGYACGEQATIAFFSAFKESDNSIKPDFFVGSYGAKAISVQYCVRVSNDWPPEYNCESAAAFKPVAKCPPS